MKFFDLIKTANHNLFRNKTRTFLTILAVFVGSFTIILNTAINAGVNDFIDKQVESIGGDGYIEIAPAAAIDMYTNMMSGEVQEYDPNAKTVDTSYLDDETLEKLLAVDGVKSLSTYHQISADYVTSEKTDKKYKIELNLLPDNSLTVDTTAGRQPLADADERELILNQSYVSALGFSSDEDAVGKTVEIVVPETLKCIGVKDRSECQVPVKAVITGVQAPGVMSTGGGLRANNALYKRIYEVQSRGLDETSKLAYMATGSVDPEKLDTIREEFKKLGFSIMTIDDEVGMIRTFFDVILVVFNIFGVIALLAAAIGIINTLFMSVQERTREIGLMKALGMSNFKIFCEFSLEAILLGFWGSVFGIALSMLLGTGINKLAVETFLSDFPTFTLTKFEPLTMLTITLIIMLIAFLAGTLPARKASKKDPIEALRYE